MMAAVLGVSIFFALVEGSGACPSASEVAERLRALVPEAAAATGERARVSDAGGGARVELFAADGARIAERTLAAAPCADLAQAAAVVIAAWESELRESAAAQVNLPAARPRRHAGFEISAAYLLAIAKDTKYASGASLTIAVGERGKHFLGRLELAFEDTRNLALDVGHTSWSRPFFAALGPLFRFRPSRLVLDLHAEALAAALYYRGVGFSTTQSGYDWDFGFGAGVRGAIAAGPARFFAGVGFAGWIHAPTLQITAGTTTPSVAVPPIEALLTFGISFGND
jgi:hypothetical protein